MKARLSLDSALTPTLFLQGRGALPFHGRQVDPVPHPRRRVHRPKDLALPLQVDRFQAVVIRDAVGDGRVVVGVARRLRGPALGGDKPLVEQGVVAVGGLASPEVEAGVVDLAEGGPGDADVALLRRRSEGGQLDQGRLGRAGARGVREIDCAVVGIDVGSATDSASDSQPPLCGDSRQDSCPCPRLLHPAPYPGCRAAAPRHRHCPDRPCRYSTRCSSSSSRS